MDKYDELEKLQKLKESGALSEEEFITEKNKLLQGKIRKKKLPKWLDVIVTVIIVIAVFALIGKISEINDKNDVVRNGEKYIRETTSNTNTKSNTVNNTTTNNDLLTDVSLTGKHNIVYLDGIDLSDVTGYINLKVDNTFKIYVKYIGIEFTNIEGTYTISGDKILINITKEGGYDLGSEARKDEIIIAQDNLAYANMKFAK